MDEVRSRYRLVRTVASGGMAQVYEAMLVGARGFERRVALKRILPEHAEDASVRRMFFDEARLASHLQHGSIVQVLDYGVLDGAEFIVMEFVDGVDAARAARQGRVGGTLIPVGVALHIMAEVAHALHHAHTCKGADGASLEMVHRDVSPQNILLSWEGDVKLSDFGIAFAARRQEKTRTGIVKGKLGYMAPEQAAGRAVTGAADVFALGRTVEAILVGSPPRRAALGTEAARDRLPREATKLLSDCLQAAPGARPPAVEVADLAGHLAAETLTRDARGALRDWLAPMREGLARRSPLDDLMGLSLVALGGRAFTVQGARTTVSIRGQADPAAPLPLPAAREATPPEAARPPRRRWWIAAVGLAAGAGAGTGVLLTQLLKAPPATSPRLGSAPPRSADTGSRGAAVGPASRPLLVVRPDAALPDQAVVQPAQVAQAPVKARTRGKARPRGRASPVAGANAARRGWLRVGGPGLASGRVEIDGAPAGYAPLERELGWGAHRVVVRDIADGRVLVDTHLVIGEQHTRGNGFRLLR